MPTEPDRPSVPQWQQLALAAVMFLTNGSFGFLQPFVPLYLQAAGLSKTEFGLAIALGTGISILLQPLLGRLSDRLDARRPFMVLAGLCSALAYHLFLYSNSFWTFTLLTALGANGFQYLNSVGGVLVGRLVGVGAGGAAYVRFRVWGSVGYILIGFTAGLLVTRSLPTGAALTRQVLDPLFNWGPILFVVLAGLSLLVPDLKRPSTPATTTPADKPNAARVTDLRYFYLSVFLYQFALYGASQFLPLYMRQLGAEPLYISAMFAGGVVVEVLTMTQIGRWTDRYGRRPALAATFLILPLRLLLYVPATGPLWVMGVQLLHGVNFGIMGTMAIVYVNDCAGDQDRGALQAKFAGLLGLATATGPLLCGFLSDQIGIRWMFACMAMIAVVGVSIFLRHVRESHPNPETPPGLLRYLA